MSCSFTETALQETNSNVLASFIVRHTSIKIPTILVKSPWDTRHKSLTELPVVSYCYQIIVLSTHSLTPSPLSPQINVELNMYEVFSPTATLSRGRGGGWTTFLQGT